MADPSVSLCDEANVDGYVNTADDVLRSLIVCVDAGERDQYVFLHSALAKCERCFGFLAASWRRSQSRHSESSGLDRRGGLVIQTPVRKSGDC